MNMKMTLSRAHWLALACLLLLPAIPSSAGAWTLTGEVATWEIDERTGAIRAGATVDGTQAIGRCRDVYEVVYNNRVETAKESDCEVVSAETNGLPTTLTIECRLPDLGLLVTKRYRIDERTGWLMKDTSLVGPELEKGFTHLLSNVRVPAAVWNEGYLYHPIYNYGGNPMIRGDEVVDERHFTCAEGTGLMTLSRPGLNLAIGHFRYGSQGEVVYFDHVIGIRGIGIFPLGEVEQRPQVTVARPGQWTMSAGFGAVGNGVTEPVSVEMGYALIPGDLYDFALAYKSLPEIRAITDHEALSAPAWVRDQLIDVWTDYQMDNKITGAAYGQLFERMWFGVVTMVVFGYYEATYSYPGDDQQWEKHLSTLPASQELLDHFKRRGVDPSDYIVRSNPNEFVMRNTWKPSTQRAAIREVMEASGNAERLKPAIYSHMGTMGLDRETPFVKEHPELLVTRANGETYRHATDYNLVRERPVGVLLQGGSPLIQDWWVRTLERQFEFFEPEITYFDTLFRSAVMVDWKHHVAT